VCRSTDVKHPALLRRDLLGQLLGRPRARPVGAERADRLVQDDDDPQCGFGGVGERDAGAQRLLALWRLCVRDTDGVRLAALRSRAARRGAPWITRSAVLPITACSTAPPEVDPTTARPAPSSSSATCRPRAADLASTSRRRATETQSGRADSVKSESARRRSEPRSQAGRHCGLKQQARKLSDAL
jgi:hypothetical protein